MTTTKDIDPTDPDAVEAFLQDAAVCTAALPLAMAKVIRELQKRPSVTRFSKTGAYLADGTKIVLKWDGRAARLQHLPQAQVVSCEELKGICEELKEMKEYVKLSKGNDWGYEYVAPPGKALDKNGFANAKRRLKLKDGDLIQVRWPNGKEETLSVSYRTKHFSINDMGHPYAGDYEFPGVDVEVNGVTKWVSLMDVEVVVTPEMWSEP